MPTASLETRTRSRPSPRDSYEVGIPVFAWHFPADAMQLAALGYPLRIPDASAADRRSALVQALLLRLEDADRYASYIAVTRRFTGSRVRAIEACLESLLHAERCFPTRSDGVAQREADLAWFRRYARGGTPPWEVEGEEEG